MLIPEIDLKKIEEYKNFDISEIFKHDYNLKIGGETDLYNLDEFYNIHIVNGLYKSHNRIDGLSVRVVESDTSVTKDSFKHIALTLNSKFIVIDIDKTLDKPIVLINYYTEENGLSPSNIIFNCNNKAEVHLMEITISDRLNSGINNRVFKSEKSKLHYSRVDLTESMNTLIYNYSGTINGGEFKTVLVDNSSLYSVNNWNIDLTKKDSSAYVYSVIDVNSYKKHGNICKLNHLVGDTQSDQEFRHILADNSVSMYDGDSFIKTGAAGSNSRQYSKAIMLSKDARVYNKPRLNIYNSDVKASHGASVGKLNSEDIFYMKQRGLSEDRIKTILLDAFASDIINRIENPVIREFVYDKR